MWPCICHSRARWMSLSPFANKKTDGRLSSLPKATQLPRYRGRIQAWTFKTPKLMFWFACFCVCFVIAHFLLDIQLSCPGALWLSKTPLNSNLFPGVLFFFCKRISSSPPLSPKHLTCPRSHSFDTLTSRCVWGLPQHRSCASFKEVLRQQDSAEDGNHSF